MVYFPELAHALQQNLEWSNKSYGTRPLLSVKRRGQANVSYTLAKYQPSSGYSVIIRNAIIWKLINVDLQSY